MNYKEKVIDLLNSKELSKEQKEKLEDIFPELAESEDEKIRKEIISALQYANHKGVYDKHLAWLEKQGSQDNADKAEPKFKVGDWCIDNEDGTILQIVKVLNNTYTYETNEGKEYSCTHYSLENDARLWTIDDAKDGDVLCDYYEAYDNPLIFILKKFEHVDFGLVKPSDYSSYCFLTSGDRQMFKEGTYHHKHNIQPATKEQRDLLFSKIKEAGYEWDAENKELRKIEDESVEEFNGEDYGIDSMWHAQRILENTLGKVEGYQSDDGILEHKCAISAVKKLYNQKPAWSEEDEQYFNFLEKLLNNLQVKSTENEIKHGTNSRSEYYYNIKKWLKSLRPQTTWKPSEEQMNALKEACDEHWEPDGLDPLYTLYQDLKKRV